MTNQTAIPAARALLMADEVKHGAPFKGRMYINGEWTESADEQRFERHSPAHGHVVSSFPEATAKDVEAAIHAAEVAFRQGAWPKLKGVERARVLLAVADGIKARVDEMSMLESLETGKPLSQARGEVSGCVDLWQYAASLARTTSGDAYDTLGEDMLGIVLRQPIGVVGLITPWNFPLWILSQKLPFALAAGCTCIVKPSELTSSTTVMLMEILEEAGVPPGVVNVVTGKGPTVGQPLAEHPAIDMLSFTGSTRVGSILGGLASKTSRRSRWNSAERIRKSFSPIATGTRWSTPSCSACTSTPANAATAAAGCWFTNRSPSALRKPSSSARGRCLLVTRCIRKQGRRNRQREPVGRDPRQHRERCRGRRAPAARRQALYANGLYLEPTIISDARPR